MTSQTKPNVIASMFGVHAAISRGLEVAAEHVQSISSGGSSDLTTRPGFLNYLFALSATITAHHLLEDEVAFPYFRNLMPDAPFDLLSEQHEELVPLVEEVNTSIRECRAGKDTAERFRVLHTTLEEILGLWYPHIGIEQEHFTFERFDNLQITDEENERIAAAFGEHSRLHAVPPELVIPFVLFNLDSQTRTMMEGQLPTPVVQQLVPVVWKDHWTSMKPFLLD